MRSRRMSLDPSRAQRFTASMAPWLMSGRTEIIQRLWLRAIGDPRYEPDDFEGSWLARYGLAIEPVALDWHSEVTGNPLIERGRQCFHPNRDWCSCTLDAYRESDRCVIDVKAVNAFRDLSDVLSFYVPQLVIQMECRAADNASLLVVRGGTEPVELPVYFTEAYRALMWDRIDHFWNCVLSLAPPCELHFKRIVPPEKLRRIDLDHDESLPNWAQDVRRLLHTIEETSDAAQANEKARQEIRSYLSDDIGTVTCGGYRINRNRAGVISIRHTTSHA